jgi:hypothetical protein
VLSLPTLRNRVAKPSQMSYTMNMFLLWCRFRHLKETLVRTIRPAHPVCLGLPSCTLGLYIHMPFDRSLYQSRALSSPGCLFPNYELYREFLWLFQSVSHTGFFSGSIPPKWQIKCNLVEDYGFKSDIKNMLRPLSTIKITRDPH